MQLWESLYDVASDIQVPCLVGGDFNVITNDEEKLGGLPVSEGEKLSSAIALICVI